MGETILYGLLYFGTRGYTPRSDSAARALRDGGLSAVFFGTDADYVNGPLSVAWERATLASCGRTI